MSVFIGEGYHSVLVVHVSVFIGKGYHCVAILVQVLMSMSEGYHSVVVQVAVFIDNYISVLLFSVYRGGVF